MKVFIKNEFEYPMDAVLKVTHYNMINNLEKYKEVLDLEDVRRTHFTEHADGRQEVEFTVCAHKQIPKAAQVVVQPHMLTWRQVGKWDPRSRVYAYEVIPFFLRNAFYLRGTCKYTEDDTKVYQTIEYTCSVKIPIVGGLIEQTIAREFRRSQNRINVKQRQMLREEFGEPSK